MKKNEELLHSIGDIDDRYIENAKPKEIAKKNKIWISSVAAAACLMFAAGLTYYFVVRPINDINNKGNHPDNIITTTAVIKTTEPPQTQQNEVTYPEIKVIDPVCFTNGDNRLQGGSSYYTEIECNDENIIIQEVINSDIETWYLSAEIESLDKKIYLKDINGITANFISGSDACFNDNYLYILLHGGTLYSVSLKNDQIIAKQEGFHFEMDLSGHTECLGVDNDGNVYIVSGECTSDGEYVNTIIKYNPELTKISEYSTNNYIPFEHIVNFNDIYIDSDDILHCEYDDEKTVRINLADGSINCDDEIIKEGEYWHVKNESGEKSLTTYSGNYQCNSASINYIDSKINLSIECGKKVRYTQLNQNGDLIKNHEVPDQFSAFSHSFYLNKNNDIQSIFHPSPNSSDDLLKNDLITYNMMSGSTDVNAMKKNESYQDDEVIYPFDFSADDLGNYYLTYNLQSYSYKSINLESFEYPLMSMYDKKNNEEQVMITLKEDDRNDFSDPEILLKDDVPYVITRCQYRENSIIYKPDFENKSYSKTSDIPGKLYPQSDGTVLCILKDILYSYSVDSGKMTKIFDFPQEVAPSDESFCDIKKIDQSSYACLIKSEETKIYILTL